jgi:tetratricopeptide (TPR) repeat protein
MIVLIVSIAAAEEPGVFSENFHGPLDSWINGEIGSDELLVEMNRLDGLLERDVDSWENLYWRSRAALVRGEIFYEREDSELSIAELEKSQKFAQDSIGIHDNSDSWRIMSEGSSLIMIQKDIGYIILNFAKGQEQAKKSLELDPRNARASLVVAQFLCNAPWIAGGNMKEGIKILKDSSERRDLIDEDRFYILLTLSEVLQKDKQIDNATITCEEALNIFPGNQNGQNLLLNLKELK